MSLIYWLAINSFGHFRLGRFIDLFQFDLTNLLLLLVLFFEYKRWRRIKDR